MSTLLLEVERAPVALVIGDSIWWNDPEHGISSGIYTITDILAEDGEIHEDTIVCLRGIEGSAVEAFVHELSHSKPEDLYPVVTMEGDSVSVCGYAKTMAAALDAAIATGNDAESVFLAVNVILADGSVAPRAWIAA